MNSTKILLLTLPLFHIQLILPSYLEKFLQVQTYPEVAPVVQHFLNFDICNPKGKNISKELLEDCFTDIDPIVPLDEVMETIDVVLTIMQEQMLSSCWSDGAPIPENYFTQELTTIFNWEEKNNQTANIKYDDVIGNYVPFEKALILPDDAKIITISDLHGGVKTLATVLNDYVETSNCQILDENVHLILMGDLVNTGLHSVETVLLCAKLLAKNPNQVHIIRGNNDVPDKTINGGFLDEIRIKYPNITKKQINKIFRFFDTFSEALWVRYETDYENNQTNWKLFIHGGPEIGDLFTIPELLNCTNSVTYKRVGVIDKENTIIMRDSAFDILPTNLRLALFDAELTHDVHTVCNYRIVCPDSGQCNCHSTTKRNFRISYHSMNLNVEDFYDKNTDEPTVKYFYSWVVKKALIDECINYIKQSNHNITHVYRGHQHTYSLKDYRDFPIMEQIHIHKGLFTLPQYEHDENENPKKGWELTTLGVAPDSRYGLGIHHNNEYSKHSPGAVYFTVPTITNKNTEYKMYTNILPELFLHTHNQLLAYNVKQ